MSRLIPQYNLPSNQYFSTRDQDLALCNNYIGETILRPTRLSNAIRLELGLWPRSSVKVYFFGTPDEYLKKLFGISDK